MKICPILSNPILNIKSFQLSKARLRLFEDKTRPEVYSSALFSTLTFSESLILEMAKIWPIYGQNMVLPWFIKLFFLNYNQCAQGCSMPNFAILGVSYSPPFLKTAKIWPKHGPHMVRQISSS